MPHLSGHAGSANQGASPVTGDPPNTSRRVRSIPAGASGEAQGFNGKLHLLYKRRTQCTLEGDPRSDFRDSRGELWFSPVLLEPSESLSFPPLPKPKAL